MQEISKHTYIHIVSGVVTCDRPGLVLPLGECRKHEHNMADGVEPGNSLLPHEH